MNHFDHPLWPPALPQLKTLSQATCLLSLDWLINFGFRNCQNWKVCVFCKSWNELDYQRNKLPRISAECGSSMCCTPPVIARVRGWENPACNPSSGSHTPVRFGERLFKVPIIAFPAAAHKSSCSFENVSLLAIPWLRYLQSQSSLKTSPVL